MNYNVLPYALAAIVLGIVGMTFHDFALVWQPVPAGIPMRTPLAYASAAILMLVGCALLVRRYERVAALAFLVFFGIWVVVLHLPVAFESAGHIAAWNPTAEITFLAMGALALWAGTASPVRRPLVLAARVIAGASAIVFGLVHMNHIKATAEFVPAWIPPSQVFWAWLTGAGHVAAGFALVSGIQARLAATLLTGMMASFVVLLHIPRVIGAPDSHFEWCMLSLSSALTGSAWLIRRYST